jgi:O-antigen ligase
MTANLNTNLSDTDNQHLSFRSSQHPNQKHLKIIIPYLNSFLTTDIKLIFILQPLFWLAGLEQIVPAMLVLWMLFKRILINARLRIPSSIWLALIFWIWQLLHFFTLPDSELDLFIKSQGTWLTLVGLFVIIYNVANSQEHWDKILSGIELFGAITVSLGLLYIVGILDFQVQSLLGKLLPASFVSNSHFFTTISLRSFGFPDATGLPRVRSTFWHPSSYASALLVLFAIEWFQLKRKSLKNRKIRLVLLALVIINLGFTFSRTTYIAFALMIFLIWWLGGQAYWSRLQKIITLGLFSILVLIYLYIVFLFKGELSFNFLTDIVYNFRPYSILARVRVYEISWQLFLEKPLWGWGTWVKIEGLPSAFSAGSHSDYLSVLFQFGIPGLLFYLGFIGITGYVLLKGYFSAKRSEARSFFSVTLALMMAMLVRQVTSELLWDLYVVSIVWGMWALGTALYANEKA